MVLPLYHYGSFSRKIISWNISSRPNADLVIQTFQKAYHTRNCPAGLMFHSDRGSQYITFAFRKLLDELNVVQSFSKKAYPFDNACCESFFKYLKKEETNRRNFRTYRDLYHSVFQYIKDFAIGGSSNSICSIELERYLKVPSSNGWTTTVFRKARSEL